MVADLVVKRVELQSTVDNLVWSNDGSLFLNTLSQSTILKPKYVKDKVKSSVELFDFQKLHIEALSENMIFLSEPIDEETSTLFSSPDTTISKAAWSPLTMDQNSYIALLTNHHTLLIISDGKEKFNIKSNQIYDSFKDFKKGVVQSFEWIRHDAGVYLVVGFSSGDAKIYEIGESRYEEVSSFKVSDSAIVNIKTHNNILTFITASNEIFLSRFQADTFETPVVNAIQDKSRFKIYDLIIKNDVLCYSTVNQFIRIHIDTLSRQEMTTGMLEYCRIFPNGENFILVSISRTLSITSNLEVMNENIVEASINQRLAKWKAQFNDFRTRTPLVNIFGVDTNYNGSILALLYEIEDNEGLRYKISSENIQFIAFIPLQGSQASPTQSSSLAIFQEHQISNTFSLPRTAPKMAVEYSLDFATFLKRFILLNPEIQSLAAENIVKRNNDRKISEIYARELINYVQKNKLKIDNNLDKAFYSSLLLISGMKETFEAGAVEVSNDTITEVFDIDRNIDVNILKSQSSHEWNRCSLTLLPILSPEVKLDPVTDKRILDIERDTFNDYGYLTKTVLQVLSQVSIYSGCRYVTK